MAAALDLANVQGDILMEGLPKRNESFFFFTIKDGSVAAFCQSLAQVAQKITPASRAESVRKEIKDGKAQGKGDTLVSTAGANIAFSASGLRKMSTSLKKIDLKTNDSAFDAGMRANAASLNDPVKPNTSEPTWETSFMGKIHGIVLVAGSDTTQVRLKMEEIKSIFKFPGADALVEAVVTVQGKVRPGKEKGHEHFGYLDGISEPAIKGVNAKTAHPGQDIIRPGVILCNREGDEQTHPAWMTDGSFLVFRKLAQDVPAWNKFIVDSASKLSTTPDLLGARLIGRWKSGCPVQLSPSSDNKTIGPDPQKNDNFDFRPNDSTKCPIGAHIRKTNPRADLGGTLGQHSGTEPFRIMRRGIPYGDELADDPNGERGLLFVCYQSNLARGFQFIQQTWANNDSFPAQGAGLDATIGQSNGQKMVEMLGLNPKDSKAGLGFHGLNQFVKPKGGEYFFSPSLTALRTTLAVVK
ncbi:hypothetical protein MBLNU230_g2004t1 [Neophaeotheca triangularis]